MSLKLLIDKMSQPSRAVLIFCKAANIPAEIVMTPIHKNATRTEAFKKISPFCTVRIKTIYYLSPDRCV